MEESKNSVTYHDEKKMGHLLDPVPTYDAPPAYSGEKTGAGPMAKIPPSVDGFYSWKSLGSTFTIGPSKDEKLFFVNTHSWNKSKPTIVIRDGPTKDHPPMSMVHASRVYDNRPVTVTLPTRPNGNHTEDIVMEMTGIKRFHLPVGRSGEPETFEWRSSRGKEIKSVGGNSWGGWKLVRLSAKSGHHDERKERPHGVASDGGEVVAVMAHGCGVKVGFHFAFMGSALSEQFGEEWELMALSTAVNFWFWETQNIAAALS